MDALKFCYGLFAKDFERSVHFYQNIFDIKLIGGWDREVGKGALLYAGGMTIIEIYGAAEGNTYQGPKPVAINLALRLENASAVDEFYKRLSPLCVERCEPPKARSWGHRSFIVYNSDEIPIYNLL